MELVICDLDQSKEQTLLKGHDYKQGQFSPDGRWIAYVSNESGRDEIYVRDFPGLRGRWQISGSGATYPQWSKGEIVYLSNGSILRVEVDTKGDALRIGLPQTLLSSTARTDRSIQMALASSGGGIWYVDDSLEESANRADPIRFILNWKGE